MDRNIYRKTHINLNEIEPSEGLFNAILNRISAEKRRYARVKLFFYGSLSTMSFGALIYSFTHMSTGFSQSGFGQFLSLLFSDSAIVISYWKEFLLVLVESLPIFSIIILLLAIATLLGSLRSATKEAKILLSTT